jgi:hypothetical protein
LRQKRSIEEEEIMEDISFYNPGVDLIEAIRLNMPDTSVILVAPSDSPYVKGLVRPEAGAHKLLFPGKPQLPLSVSGSILKN